jgi:hypothetical protein
LRVRPIVYNGKSIANQNRLKSLEPLRVWSLLAINRTILMTTNADLDLVATEFNNYSSNARLAVVLHFYIVNIKHYLHF